MPIYEYRCENGHTFEVMQRMTEDPVLSCETCAAPVERVFHPVAVHFKGSGFYNTDYGTKRRPKDAGDGAESKPSESKTSETKPSESKSETKASASSD